MTSVYLATGPAGLARAELPGADVERVAAGFDVRCVSADPRAEHNVYAGTQGGGVLRSDDGGRTWRPSGLDGWVVKSLAISAAAPGRVYAGTEPACLFVSEDRGETWRELGGFRRIFSRRFWFSPAERPFKAYVQGIALSPKDPDLIVAGIEAGAVVRSADAGRSWQDHRRGAMRDCHHLVAHATVDGRLYEGGYGGGACSTDAGETWRRPAGLDRKYGWAVAADAANPNCWYVSVAPGVQAHSDHAQAAIFRSDGGHWRRVSGGLPEPLDFMPYALISGPAPGQLLAGLASGEMWESHDHGDSWTKLNLRMPSIERCLIRLQIA
ncbi:MAG: hypothetical protein E6I39_10365 [Chloroflexi bacterium]|nr:MAG: hypothetical protein E6I39_10365 [Chloroflexota bacterium]